MAKSGSMLERMIGGPEEDLEPADDAPLPGGDAKKRKKAALRAFASAMGIKPDDLDAATDAFADAVDACLEYSDEE